MTLSKEAKLFKALGDENRLRVLSALSKGKLCACNLLSNLALSQPTLSHHMKILAECGLVTGRKEGKWVHYTLEKDVLDEGIAFLNSLKEKNNSKEFTTMSNANTKLYVLSGFLGSGKTTILTKLLEGIPNKKIAVIQNEFGKLSIDGPIVKKDNIEVVELNRGSIFCSCLKLNFVNALAELALMEPDYVFVESSGLGDPSNVQELVTAANLLCNNRLELCGLLGLADGVNFFSDLEDAEMVQRQIKHCHMAVVTKTDLIDPATLEKICEKIRSINANCLVRVSSNGNLDMSFVGENLLQYANADNEESINMVDNKPKTISLQCHEAVKKSELIAFLDAVKADCYRIKGFFNIAEEGFCQVDVVGERIDIVATKERDLSQLVFISKIGPAVIKKVFNSWNEKVQAKMELKN